MDALTVALRVAAMRGTILILDDEVWISLTVSEILQDYGFYVAGPFRTNALALSYLEANRPDAALLDYQVLDGQSLATAHRLIAMCVPFIVVSGSARSITNEPDFQNAQWLEKPYGEAALLNALDLACHHQTVLSAA